jgi:hypothetical protein
VLKLSIVAIFKRPAEVDQLSSHQYLAAAAHTVEQQHVGVVSVGGGEGQDISITAIRN